MRRRPLGDGEIDAGVGRLEKVSLPGCIEPVCGVFTDHREHLESGRCRPRLDAGCSRPESPDLRARRWLDHTPQGPLRSPPGGHRQQTRRGCRRGERWLGFERLVAPRNGTPQGTVALGHIRGCRRPVFGCQVVREWLPPTTAANGTTSSMASGNPVEAPHRSGNRRCVVGRDRKPGSHPRPLVPRTAGQTQPERGFGVESLQVVADGQRGNRHLLFTAHPKRDARGDQELRLRR